MGDEAVATAHAEVAWHLTRELEATGVYENVTAYRELIAGFTTTMGDLRGFESEAFLHPEPGHGYAAGQVLARALRGLGANGVIYPSVRPEGRVLPCRVSPAHRPECPPGRHLALHG